MGQEGRSIRGAIVKDHARQAEIRKSRRAGDGLNCLYRLAEKNHFNAAQTPPKMRRLAQSPSAHPPAAIR